MVLKHIQFSAAFCVPQVQKATGWFQESSVEFGKYDERSLTVLVFPALGAGLSRLEIMSKPGSELSLDSPHSSISNLGKGLDTKHPLFHEWLQHPGKTGLEIQH